MKATSSISSDNPTIPFKIGECVACEGRPIVSTRRAVALVKNAIGWQQQEYAVVITTDNNLNVIKMRIVSIGTSTEASVSPRDIFRGAVVDGAYGIVFVHNHPHGLMRPSIADLRFTRDLVKAGNTLDIQLLDAIVIHKDKFVSFYGEGKVAKRPVSDAV